MSPKEKAVQLVEKFKEFAMQDDWMECVEDNAKSCALICVEQMIEVYDDMVTCDPSKCTKDYLLEVKREIKGL